MATADTEMGQCSCGKIALTSLPFDRFIPYQSKLNRTVDISVKSVRLLAVTFALSTLSISCVISASEYVILSQLAWRENKNKAGQTEKAIIKKSICGPDG